MVSDENGAKFTISHLTVFFLEEAIRRKRLTLEPFYVSSEALKAEVQNLISIVDDGFDHQRFDLPVPRSDGLSQPPRPRLQVRLYIWGERHKCFRRNFPSRRRKSNSWMRNRNWRVLCVMYSSLNGQRYVLSLSFPAIVGYWFTCMTVIDHNNKSNYSELSSPLSKERTIFFLCTPKTWKAKMILPKRSGRFVEICGTTFQRKCYKTRF